MKTRSFLLSTLAVFIFAGCSSEDAREGNIPSGELNGKGVSVAFPAKSHIHYKSSECSRKTGKFRGK